jgi:hypothetical protein
MSQREDNSVAYGNIAFPTKAGTHLSARSAAATWTPACAGDAGVGTWCVVTSWASDNHFQIGLPLPGSP